MESSPYIVYEKPSFLESTGEKFGIKDPKIMGFAIFAVIVLIILLIVFLAPKISTFSGNPRLKNMLYMQEKIYR